MVKYSKCWFCANAVPNEKHGCPWSIAFKPVKGWKARKTTLYPQNPGRPTQSYFVEDCPLFERDVDDDKLNINKDGTPSSYEMEDEEFYARGNIYSPWKTSWKGKTKARYGARIHAKQDTEV